MVNLQHSGAWHVCCDRPWRLLSPSAWPRSVPHDPLRSSGLSTKQMIDARLAYKIKEGAPADLLSDIHMLSLCVESSHALEHDR